MVVVIVLGAVAVAMCTVGTVFMVNAYRRQHIGVWRAYTPISIRWLWVGGTMLLLVAMNGGYSQSLNLTRLLLSVGIVAVIWFVVWLVPILIHNSRLTQQHPDAVEHDWAPDIRDNG